MVAAIERALSEKAAALRASGDLPPGVDSEVLLAEARRELFELGPVGPLLEDEYVDEVQVIRHDHIVALHAQKQVATEIAFTSDVYVNTSNLAQFIRTGTRDYSYEVAACIMPYPEGVRPGLAEIEAYANRVFTAVP
jgi:hypothetical protein